LIGSIQTTLTYPTNLGLTYSSAVASGVGAGQTFVPNGNNAGQVTVGLISTGGVSTGQFATITFAIAAGNFPTASNFAIAAGAQITDTNSNTISGITITPSVTIK
jgi:hypothetical protein